MIYQVPVLTQPFALTTSLNAEHKGSTECITDESDSLVC